MDLLNNDEIFYYNLHSKMPRLHHNPQEQTSGHPVCAAVGLANIDIIIKEKLPKNAARVGTYLRSRLDELKNKRTLIGDVRGRGLMIGIELVKDGKTKKPLSEKEIFNIVVDIAILGLVGYYRGSILGVMPPLIIDKEIANDIVGIIDKALDTSVSANIARKARLVKEFAASKLR